MQTGAAVTVCLPLHAGWDRCEQADIDQRDRPRFTKYPFFESRQIAAYLRREGTVVGRHRVRRFMAKMGLRAIYKRSGTSQSNPQCTVYQYLLKKMQIDRSNQAWCADMTLVPVKNGFLYLVAIMAQRNQRRLQSTTCHRELEELLQRRSAPFRA
ncbi:IS3 family transposase [Shimia sp. MMG029]|uniref:IS3 family transposase n=1 Tax=Shimia sp. MMG029 TaxID=3021978 RepID=UPI003F8F0C52